MTKKNNYIHISSFDDFREEKMKLYYQIRLSEKKLEIKKMELQEYLNPMRFVSAIFNDLSQYFLDLFKSFISGFMQKTKDSNSEKAPTQESSGSTNET